MNDIFQECLMIFMLLLVVGFSILAILMIGGIDDKLSKILEILKKESEVEK